MAQGCADQARAHIDKLFSMAESYQTPKIAASARILRARLMAGKEPVSAEEDFLSALAEYRQTNQSYDLAVVSLYYSMFLYSRGRHNDAESPLSEAEDTFRKIGNRQFLKAIAQMKLAEKKDKRIIP